MRFLRIKNFLKKPSVQIAIFVFLVSLLSFGLGYWLAQDWQKTPIIIEKAQQLDGANGR
jgi:hypothetical protein